MRMGGTTGDFISNLTPYTWNAWKRKIRTTKHFFILFIHDLSEQKHATKKRAFYFCVACIKNRRCEKKRKQLNESKERKKVTNATTNIHEWYFRVYGNFFFLLTQSFLMSEYNSMRVSFVNHWIHLIKSFRLLKVFYSVTHIDIDMMAKCWYLPSNWLSSIFSSSSQKDKNKKLNCCGVLSISDKTKLFIQNSSQHDEIQDFVRDFHFKSILQSIFLRNKMKLTKSSELIKTQY